MPKSGIMVDDNLPFCYNNSIVRKQEHTVEFYVEGTPKIKTFIESLLPSMLEQLKLTKSRKFLHIKLDRELEDLGTTIPLTGIDTYLVVLKPNKDLVFLAATLAHELTHVAQFSKGTLQVARRGKKWKGKFYPTNHPYLDQPWEVQAFARQEIIMRRALEE
jgi:predicted SprT family Zn-dependent metalloprotease